MLILSIYGVFKIRPLRAGTFESEDIILNMSKSKITLLRWIR